MSAPPPAPSTAPPSPPRPRPRGWRWPLLIAGVLVAVVACQRALLTVCLVDGASMSPELPAGSRVLVLRVGLDLARGDVIVAAHPDAPDEMLVKRVVGLPGERVRTTRGRVWVDERELLEPWLGAGTLSEGLPPTTVPPGHVLILGDNRGDSVDSRRFGPLDVRHVRGEVVAIWR